MREKEVIDLVLKDYSKNLKFYRDSYYGHFLATGNSLDEKVVREWHKLPGAYRSEIAEIVKNDSSLRDRSLDIESINLLRERDESILLAHILYLIDFKIQNTSSSFYHRFFWFLLESYHQDEILGKGSVLLDDAQSYHSKNVGQFFTENITQDDFFDNVRKLCIDIYGENYGLFDLCYLLTYCESQLGYLFFFQVCLI